MVRGRLLEWLANMELFFGLGLNDASSKPHTVAGSAPWTPR